MSHSMIDQYWQKYPAKIQSFFCAAGDIAGIASGAAGGNIFRGLAPLVGLSSHLINLVFGAGGKFTHERFVIEAEPPHAFLRALQPWRYAVDSQAALIVGSGLLFALSGLNVMNVQGFVNIPELLAGCFCMLAALIQWLMPERDAHLADAGVAAWLNAVKRGKGVDYLKHHLGPTRCAALLFMAANSWQILAGFYAMLQHHALTKRLDVLMVLSGCLYLYGNYNLARVKKAKVVA